MRQICLALRNSLFRRRRRYNGILAALALWALTAAFGQDSGPPLAPRRAQPLVRISVDMVRLDVVVTDKQGRHVTGLQVEDFDVFQNRKRQTIQTFGYVSAAEAPHTRRAGMPGPIPSYSLRPQQVDRSLAFIIDEFSLSPSSMKAVHDTLASFVEE